MSLLIMKDLVFFKVWEKCKCNYLNPFQDYKNLVCLLHVNV